MQPANWERLIWKNAFVKYLAAQKVTDAQVARILRDAAGEAERLIAESIGDDSISATVRRAQLSQSAKKLTAMQAELWNNVGEATQQGIARTSTLAAEALVAVNGHLGDVIRTAGVNGAYNAAQQFELAASRAVENVRSRAINNIPLSSSVYKNSALAKGKVDQVVNRGIALNKSAREIAKDVHQYIDPATQGGAKYAANRLARTEINNAFHTTSVQGVQDMPWINGVKWNLSGSHPKPDECNVYAEKDHDGLGAGIFNRKNVPGKPHPNCLCYTTTVTDSNEAFMQNLLGGGYDKYLKSNGYNGFN